MLGSQFTCVVFSVSDTSSLYLILQSVLQSYDLSPQKPFRLCLGVLG